MKMNYSYNEMERAFECGRNFQLTGENNFKELIEELNKDCKRKRKLLLNPSRIPKTYVVIPQDAEILGKALTKGKKYYPFDIASTCFRIFDDNGVELFCLYKECAHITGSNWIIGTDI